MNENQKTVPSPALHAEHSQSGNRTTNTMLRVSSRRSNQQVRYRKLKCDSVFANSACAGVAFDSSLYVSPSSSFNSPAVISEIESSQKNADSKAMSFPTANSFTSASSISFDSRLELSFDVDHVAKLLAHSLEIPEMNHAAVEEPLATFSISSAITSPLNRVRIDEVHQVPLTRVNTEPIQDSDKDATPKMTNAIQQQVTEVPNFSFIISPVSKKEDHTFSIDGDSNWSFNRSQIDDFNKSTKPLGANLMFASESNWVEFEPFEVSRTRQQSFILHTDEPEKVDVVQQLHGLNERLLRVEHALRNHFAGHGFDDLSTAFLFDDDDKTCTPIKSSQKSSALFGRFLGKKSALCEI